MSRRKATASQRRQFCQLAGQAFDQLNLSRDQVDTALTENEAAVARTLRRLCHTYFSPNSIAPDEPEILWEVEIEIGATPEISTYDELLQTVRNTGIPAEKIPIVQDARHYYRAFDLAPLTTPRKKVTLVATRARKFDVHMSTAGDLIKEALRYWTYVPGEAAAQLILQHPSMLRTLGKESRHSLFVCGWDYVTSVYWPKIEIWPRVYQDPGVELGFQSYGGNYGTPLDVIVFARRS